MPVCVCFFFCERALSMFESATAGGPSEAARAGGGAGHHGGRERKPLHRHLWRDGKWKDNSSAPVPV